MTYEELTRYFRNTLGAQMESGEEIPLSLCAILLRRLDASSRAITAETMLRLAIEFIEDQKQNVPHPATTRH